MACLDTQYKSPDKKGHYPPMSPRLSFSKDFVQSHTPTPQHPNTTTTPSDSTDFEFSAPTHPVDRPPMAAADKLFLNGKLLPTLRDELLLGDGDDMSPNAPTKWRGFFSLKRSSLLDGRCTAANTHGKIPKLALDDKPPQIPAPPTTSLLF